MIEKNKGIFNEDININTDWGGDESTNFLPVSGRSIQKFLKDQLTGLSGQIEGVQERVSEVESTSSSNLSALTTLIQELQNTIQELKNKEVIKVLSRAEWEELKRSGQVKDDVLYGIIEEEGEDEPDIPITEGGDIFVNELGELEIVGLATIEDDTLSIIGSFDEDTETLTITGGQSSGEGGNFSITDDEVVIFGTGIEYNQPEETITVVGQLDSSAEELILTNL